MDAYEHSVAYLLTEATGQRFTPQDINDWLGEDGAGPAFDKVDKAVERMLGSNLYQAAETTARLPDVLSAVLRGLNQLTVGGMTFQLDLDRPPVAITLPRWEVVANGVIREQFRDPRAAAYFLGGMTVHEPESVWSMDLITMNGVRKPYSYDMSPLAAYE